MNIIAHRGASKARPQNTIPAFLEAIKMGANGVENDVHMTSDGHLVIIHDYVIDDLSNGTGRVSEMTLDDLRQYDFGSYFSTEYEGTKIPTLEEFLDIADGFEIINIEIKSPESKEVGLVEKTIKLVKDFNLKDHLLISSFDVNILKEVKELDANIQTGLLYSPDSPFIEEIFEDPFEYAKSIKANALHPLAFYVDDEYVETAHKYGFTVNPWTVNLKEGIKALKEWGCDGIITDVPDIAKEAIG